MYVKARHWGEAYAKTRFGSAWTTGRVKGQIESAVEGKTATWIVKWYDPGEGEDQFEEMTSKTLIRDKNRDEARLYL